MSAFPTLSINPELPIGETREDSTIRTDMEGGYEHTRARFTRIRRTFKIIYRNLPGADKSTLDAFVTTVKCGADSFTWAHPVTQTQYTVRFKPIPEYSYTTYNYYDVEFGLLEV